MQLQHFFPLVVGGLGAGRVKSVVFPRQHGLRTSVARRCAVSGKQRAGWDMLHDRWELE